MQERVLIVDPYPPAGESLADTLSDQYQVAVVPTAQACLERMASFQADLVLLDVALPDLDGFEVCRRIKSAETGRLIQVILITDRDCVADRIAGYGAGADDYLARPVDAAELLAKAGVHLQLGAALRRMQTAETKLKSYNDELERVVDSRTSAIQATQDIAVFAMAKLADSRDPETGEHLVRMRLYSQILAERLHVQGPYTELIDEEFLNDLYRSSPLHDIGKVGITDAVLLKPGRLTPEEFDAMKEHTLIGAETLEQAAHSSNSGSFLEMAAQIALSHHERWDGGGYPHGLSGLDIPLPARIVAVADVFDAITSKRVYKEASDPHKAREIIEAAAGEHFDPAVVEAFGQCFGEFVQVVESADYDYRPRSSCSSLANLPQWRVGAERGVLHQAAGRRVLVVDDEPQFLELIATWLDEAGYDVQRAGGLRQAITGIEASCPEFVVADWELSDGDADELCRWVRRHPLPHYVYMMVVAGSSESKEIVRSLDAGADDFLTRPLRKDEVIGRLRAAARVVQLEHNLSRLARTDPLTGLATRRLADESMRREWQRAGRYRLPLSCAVVEVDHFADVMQGDQHTGDAVLMAVANVLNANCRVTDSLCRYAPTRFLILMPETNEHDAALWLEQARTEIASHAVAVGDAQLDVSVSAGVAQRMEDTSSLDGLISLAEQSLASATGLGGDRVVRYGTLSGGDRLAEAMRDADRDLLSEAVARDVMTTPIVSLRHTDTAQDAASFLLRHRINSAPVVDLQGQLAGVISEKDLISKSMSAGYWNRPIEAVMSRAVISFEEDAPAKEIYDFLCRAAIRRIVIVKGGRPTGVVSRGTLLRWYSHAAEGGGPDATLLPGDTSAGDPEQGLLDTVAEMIADAQPPLQPAATGVATPS